MCARSCRDVQRQGTGIVITRCDEKPLKGFGRSTCFKINLIASGWMDFMGHRLEEGLKVRYLWSYSG